METRNPTKLEVFYEKNKLELWRGLALYMAGYIAVMSPQLKKADDRADTCISAYTNHLKMESEAKSRAEFGKLLYSDTTYIVGGDSTVNDTGMENILRPKKGDAR